MRVESKDGIIYADFISTNRLATESFFKRYIVKTIRENRSNNWLKMHGYPMRRREEFYISKNKNPLVDSRRKHLLK